MRRTTCLLLALLLAASAFAGEGELKLFYGSMLSGEALPCG